MGQHSEKQKKPKTKVIQMSQLKDIEYTCVKHTKTDDEAAALFYDILNDLHWDISGVTSVETAKEYLNRER
jgi:hypothetical protein